MVLLNESEKHVATRYDQIANGRSLINGYKFWDCSGFVGARSLPPWMPFGTRRFKRKADVMSDARG